MLRSLAAGLMMIAWLSACTGFVSDQTPGPTPTPALPTPRPTFTPRPTPTLAVATPLPVQPMATATPVIYIVQAGDALIPIANRFGVSVAELIAANGIQDATRLQVGQRLVIPQPRASAMNDASQAALLPSPTPVAAEVRGLNAVRSPAGSLDVMGEVFNPGPGAIGSVKVQVTLQDDAGTSLQSIHATIPLDVLPAGQASPFRALFADPPKAFSKYTVSLLRAERSDPRASIVPLTVARVTGRLDPPQFRVAGEIANAAAEAARQVRLLVTLYDAERRVVGYRYLTLSEAPLAPNASLTFDVSLTTATRDIASFAVYAEGMR
jgi:murein DD-endopeptidase MepM/ murein hydrolase activator NlpD